MEQYQEYFGDYHLIAAFKDGKFQGRGWRIRGDVQNLSVEGSSISDVVDLLKKDAEDESLRAQAVEAERLKALHETLPQRHRERLTVPGYLYKGLRLQTHRHRESHCYNCKSKVDNASDFECVECGWIVCKECASCNCGYRV